MGAFDFVSGDEFKAGLEADYAEMLRCVEAKAWKSVHVLAGSIVEAILVDYITSSPIPAKTGIEPLALDLGGAIKLAKDNKIISDRATALSEVVRTYRNLIHPGRIVRLAETVDEDGATVAVALVEMIAKEIGKSRAETRGYTAEQVLNKVEHDASAVTILPHLVKDLPRSEHERLLLTVAPTRYLKASQDGTDPEVLSRVSKLYRTTYDAAHAEVQRKATARYIEVLREEDHAVVMAYEAAFFSGSDLRHATKAQASLVKDHLLARLKTGRTVQLFEAMFGLSAHLTTRELQTVIDAIINEIAYGTSAEADAAARSLLDDVYWNQSAMHDRLMLKRFDQWIELFKEKDRPDDIATVEGFKQKYASDLPS